MIQRDTKADQGWSANEAKSDGDAVTTLGNVKEKVRTFKSPTPVTKEGMSGNNNNVSNSNNIKKKRSGLGVVKRLACTPEPKGAAVSTLAPMATADVSAETSTDTSSSSKPTEGNEKTFAKYRKMLKMRVPPPAVENKMRKDGLGEELITLMFSTSPPPPPMQQVETHLPPQPSTQSTTNKDEEEKLTKYKKMLKMRVPPQAVQNKMREEKIEEKLIESLFPGCGVGLAQSSTLLPPSPPAPVSLSAEEEEKLTKYKKMLKMRVPPQAVQNKMREEKIEEKLIESLFPGCGVGLAQSSTLLPPSPPAPVSLSAEEEEKLTKYKKMLKMRVPPQAVQNKMREEKVEEVSLSRDNSPPYMSFC